MFVLIFLKPNRNMKAEIAVQSPFMPCTPKTLFSEQDLFSLLSLSPRSPQPSPSPPSIVIGQHALASYLEEHQQELPANNDAIVGFQFPHATSSSSVSFSPEPENTIGSLNARVVNAKRNKYFPPITCHVNFFSHAHLCLC